MQSRRYRIFIAINLPEETKERLFEYQAKWSALPVRWVKTRNLHLTLAFLDYLSDKDMMKVCVITKEVAERHIPFVINLKKICYGQPETMPPRLIWVEGEGSKELSELQIDLEKSLIASQIFWEPEKRDFRPHITLSRINQWEFRRIEPEERPEIDEEINLRFEVKSIEVMESKLKKGGAEYTILESVPLSK